ncbi:MAG: hypothetical protein AAGC67_19215, partial [Myxococcota bacterium]
MDAARIVAVAGVPVGTLRHLIEGPAELEDLVTAVFVQRRLGGELAAEEIAGGVRLVYAWPANPLEYSAARRR